MICVFLLWLVCPIVGLIAGQSRGLGELGFVLGLLLGPFGPIIVLLMPAAQPQARYQRAAYTATPDYLSESEPEEESGDPLGFLRNE